MHDVCLIHSAFPMQRFFVTPDQSYSCIVTELASGGDIVSFFSQGGRGFESPPLETIRSLFYQAVTALKHVHSQGE